MTNLEIIKRLINVIEPNDEQSEAIKQAVLALLDKEEAPAPAKPKAKPGPKKGTKRKFDTGKLKALLDGGWSVPKIADEMGVDASTKYYHIKKEGWTNA